MKIDELCIFIGGLQDIYVHKMNGSIQDIFPIVIRYRGSLPANHYPIPVRIHVVTHTVHSVYVYPKRLAERKKFK